MGRKYGKQWHLAAHPEVNKLRVRYAEKPEAWVRAKKAIEKYFIKSPFPHMRNIGKYLAERFDGRHQHAWRVWNPDNLPLGEMKRKPDRELLINKVYERACSMNNPTGKRGKLLLMDYQCILLCCVFLFDRGWIPPRIAMLIPRKQGKTTFCAVLAILMMEFSEDNAPEIFCCGDVMEQAAIVYNAIMRILQLQGVEGVVQGGKKRAPDWELTANEIRYKPNMGVIRRFAADPETALGKNYSLLLMDEAALLAPDLFEALQMGQSAARSDQFIVALSTAGKDRDSYFKKIIDTTDREVKNGESPSWVTIPFFIDEDEEVDVSDRKIWRALNPALENPAVFNEDIIADEYKEFAGKGAEHAFSVFRLNRWGRGELEYLATKDEIEATIMSANEIDAILSTNPCKIGLDLGLSKSMTGICVMARVGDIYYGKVRYFTPETWFKRRIAEGHGYNDFFLQCRESGIIMLDGEKKQTHARLKEELELYVDRYKPTELIRDQYSSGLGFLWEFEESGFFDIQVLSTTSAKKAAITNPLISGFRDRTLKIEKNDIFEWEAKGAMMIEDQQRGYYDIERVSAIQTVDGLYAIMFAMYGFVQEGNPTNTFGMENAMLGA